MPLFRARFEIARRVERCEQHRHRAASDPGEDRRGDRVQLDECRHRTRVKGAGTTTPAGEGKSGGDRRLAVDVGSELIEHRAPFDAHRGDRRCPEFVGGSRDHAGRKQTESCQPKREQADSLRSQCIAPLARAPDAVLVLGALHVGAVFGHDHDPRAGADMPRYRAAHSVGEDGGLVGRRRGLALGDRLGLHDFQRRALWHLNRNRHHVVQRELHRHVFLQIRRR